MDSRVYAVFKMQCLAYWRKSGPWLLVMHLGCLVVMMDRSEKATQLRNFTDWIGGSYEICFFVAILLGLYWGKFEKDSKLTLRNACFPVRHSEFFLGGWLALTCFVFVHFLLTVLLYFCMFGLWDSAWLSQAVTRDKIPLEKGVASEGMAPYKSPRGLKGREGFSFEVILLNSDGYDTGTTAFNSPVYWWNGQERREVQARFLCRRTAIILKPDDFKASTLLLPQKLLIEGSIYYIHVREAKLHEVELSFFASMAGVLVILMLKLLFISGLVVGLGKMISIETGFFVVGCLLLLNFCSYTLGAGAIGGELNPRVTGSSVYHSYWWEEGLLDWTRTMSFIDKKVENLRLPDPLPLFRKSQWVPAFNLGTLLAVFYMSLIFVLLIPLSRARE